MNIVLWIFQAALAFLYLSGGAFKVFSFDELAQQMTFLPRGGWTAVGLFEIAGAILLIAPAALKWMPVLTPTAATVLAVEGFALSAMFAQYSLKFTAQNPLVWNVAMGLVAAFVAYGRFALRPV